MVRLEDIIDKVASYNSGADLEVIKKAYVFSAVVHQGQNRLSGEPYLSHPLEVANILAELKMDSVSVATGLLHDTVEDTHTTVEKIDELFGPVTASLVDGLTKISRMTFEKKEDREAENFRKMLLAMGKDIRVIIIKLADRLHNMRTLGALDPAKKRKIARETLDIYAPLANRLGMGWLKTELEDLSFMYLEPERYRWLDARIAKERDFRHDYIERVVTRITEKLREHGIDSMVSGRPKHIYSIHRKMVDQEVEFENIYDIFAFRVTVGSVKECYEVLGIMHSTWKPVPGRFKDYIAIPKLNGYQSLHTTVVGPEGLRMEVQIRTTDMHRVAELGIASHWKYKEGKPLDTKLDENFAWLRQLLELQKDVTDSDEFMESLKVDLFPEEVFVFTPEGEVKEFPSGATPIDFAYAIHTDIGNTCAGARINGKMVPLRTRLRNGDVVEIITSGNHHPSNDWLKFVVTSRARNRIRQWIKAEERDKSLALGMEICEKEFAKFAVDFKKLFKSGEIEKLGAEHFGIRDGESLVASIGYGKLSARQLLRKILPAERFETKKRFSFMRVFDKFTGGPAKPSSKNAVMVQGEGDIMVKFAGCCNPLPGDEIMGFISHGQGVAVHSKGCPNLLNIDRDRWIDVTWATGSRATRPVKIEVTCRDEKGALAEMTRVLNASDTNISSSASRAIGDGRALCTFEVDVRGITHLREILDLLGKLKSVIKADRVRQHLRKDGDDQEEASA